MTSSEATNQEVYRPMGAISPRTIIYLLPSPHSSYMPPSPHSSYMPPSPLSLLQDLVSLPESRDIKQDKDIGLHLHINILYEAIPMERDYLGIPIKKAKH